MEQSVVVRIKAEVDQYKASMKQASTATTQLGTAGKSAGRSVDEGMQQSTKSSARTRSELVSLGAAAQKSAQSLGYTYNATGQLTDQFGNLVTELHATEMGLESSSDATREFAAAQAQANSAVEASATGMQGLTRDAKNHAEAWDSAGTSLMVFGGAALAVVGLSITKYAAFDKAMSSVQAATHESAANMELLREAAIRTGADTAFSAEEAAQGIEELAKAGIETADILGGGLDGALALAAAGAMSVGDAAELAATALTQFKLKGSDIPHVADLLAAGAGKAQGSVHDLGMALNQAGLVASGTGLTIEETTGTLAAFASAGLVGSDAGTAFKSMLQRLQNPSNEASREMEALGLNMYDANGSMTDMTVVADQLQSGLSKLTDAERDRALATIFGSDAVRAANVLYNQGAEGIQEWTDKVNDAGYAATTAAIMQDNLAGDLEKLGGAFDTVFIKSGGSASEALRGLVQSGEAVVDMIGKIPTPVLETGVAILGTVGAVGLAGGAFLKFTPKILDSVSAFRNLGAEGSRVPGTMGKVAKGLSIAAIAMGALSIAGDLATRNIKTNTSDMANSVLRLTKSGESLDSMNDQFRDWDTLFGSNTVHGVDSVAGAIQRLVNPKGMDGFNDAMNRALVDNGPGGWMKLAPSATKQIEERLEGVGAALGNLVSGGSQKAAAEGFRKLSDEFVKNGATAQDALDTLPGYAEALTDLGNSVGVSVTDAELLDMALGKIPPRLQEAGVSIDGAVKVVGAFKDATDAAIPVTEEMSKALEDVGLSAYGAVVDLTKYVDALVRAGLSTLSVRDAQRGYIETIEGAAAALIANGKTLDENTKAGRDNAEALDAIAQSGISVMESMANTTDAYGNQVYSQQQLSDQLKKTYTDYKANAEAMGMNSEAADVLARDVLGIPTEVNIDTWFSDFATARANQLTGAVASTTQTVEGLSGKLTELHGVIQSTPDKEIIITEPMSPEIKLGLENLGYIVETLPDGTIKVSETGTDATGKKIDDTARRERIARIDAVAATEAADRALDGVAAKQRRSTIFVDMVLGEDRATPAAPAGIRRPGGAFGGRVDDIMGFWAGGRVPGPAHPTGRKDNVLGMVNGQPIGLQGTEWIINPFSSSKYDKELAAMNAGTFPEGVLGREYNAVAPTGNFSGAPAAGPSHFTGDLYLDSGEFLGKVQGIARAEADRSVESVDNALVRFGRGGKYVGGK